jgi:hypothetical protein
MRKISAILLTTTALIGGSQASADAPGMNDPFFWIGEDASAPEQSEVIGNGQATEMQREKFTDMNQPAAKGNSTTAPEYPKNPVLDDYPTQHSTNTDRSPSSNPLVAADGCAYHEGNAATVDFAVPKPRTGARGTTPEDQRRGEMAGTDGVLSAVQDTPCVDIMRRGGETANSAQGHLREGDIRRANTLEERRIPTHSVGRYSPEGSGLWHRDPANPFIDAASEWAVHRGETLSQMLHRWADDAGFTIVYQADIDYVLQADVVIRGTFSEAAGQVIESFANASPPISADYYLGNKVIVVRSSGEFDGR